MLVTTWTAPLPYRRRAPSDAIRRRPTPAPRSSPPRRDPASSPTGMPTSRPAAWPMPPGPAQPDPLPLRQQAAAHPRGPRGRERPPSRAPARDVRWPRAALASVGARLRLPRRGSPLWLRPGAPGDDRRRLVRSRRSPRRFARSQAAGTGCWPRSRSARRHRSAGSGRSRPSEVAALMGMPFLGAESVILLGFTESSVPARSALRKVGIVIRTLEETIRRARRERIANDGYRRIGVGGRWPATSIRRPRPRSGLDRPRLLRGLVRRRRRAHGARPPSALAKRGWRSDRGPARHGRRRPSPSR